MTYSYFFSFLFLNNCKSIVFILLHQTICYIFYCFPYNFQLKDPSQPPLQRGGVQPCRSSWLINYISKNFLLRLLPSGGEDGKGLPEEEFNLAE